MKLADITSDSWMYLERYVNDKTYSRFSSYSAVNEKFRPEETTNSFKLPFFYLPVEDVTLRYSNFSDNEKLRNLLFRGSQIIFYVHPETLQKNEHNQWHDHFLQTVLLSRCPDGYVEAIPTASTRTVYLPEHNLFLKLHLPKRVSRFQRRIHEPHISHNIQLMDELISTLDGTYHILPDLAGVFQNDTAWGFIVRDANPYPLKKHHQIIMPAFSLYGIDIYRREDEPLLIQFIKHHKADPIHFLLPIIRQIVAAWWQVYTTTGVVFDPHGQNVLLILTDKLEFEAILVRDFYGPDVDNDHRKKLNLPQLETDMDASNRGGVGPTLSNTYDYHFGHHMLDFINRALVKYFLIDENLLPESVKVVFHDIVDTSKFPSTVYEYVDRTFVGGQETVYNTGKVPTWR